MRPVSDPVTCAYGVPGSHWAAGRHTGIDYGSPVGTPAAAAADGSVIYAGSGGGWGPAYGTQVILETTIGGTKYRCLYAHLSSTSVKAGAQVAIGRVVGKTGATGNVTGPHLHFEVRHAPYAYGDDVNPNIAVEVGEMTEDDWQRLTKIVNTAVDRVWAEKMTVTQPGSGEDLSKSRQQVLRETYQGVKKVT